METHKTESSLVYTDSDGVRREIKGCRMRADQLDRYWIWSDQLGHNIVYKTKGRENALLASIDSLLFTIHLRDERIRELQRVENLALAFADEIKPDETEK